MSSEASDTRTRILEAAKSLLQRRGMPVRLEDVARGAGVSRQAVYLHFGSRVGVLEALVAYLDVAERVGEVGRLIRDAPDAVSALDAIVEHRAAYIPRIQPVVQALIEDRRRDEAARAAYDDRTAVRRKHCRLLVGRLKSEGLLVAEWSVQSAVDAMLVLLSIPTWEQLALENGWSKERYAKQMKTILRRSFVRREPHG